MAELEDASPDSDTAFEPQDAIAKSTRSVAITGGAGLLLAAVQNTVARENLGAMGVFTRFGGTVAMFGTLYWNCSNEIGFQVGIVLARATDF